jgi:hypothetical protein
MKKAKIIFIFLSLILIALPAQASLLSGDKYHEIFTENINLVKEQGGDSNYVDRSVEETVGIIIRAAMTFLGAIFITLMIIAGINWMRAEGNEEMITKSKKTITNLMIGLVLAIAAYTLSYTISNILINTLRK